jgi:hypothetical protein
VDTQSSIDHARHSDADGCFVSSEASAVPINVSRYQLLEISAGFRIS